MTVYEKGVPVFTTFTFTSIPPGFEAELGLGWKLPVNASFEDYRLEVIFVDDLNNLIPLFPGYLQVSLLEDGRYVVELEASKTGNVFFKLLNPEGVLVLASQAFVKVDNSFYKVLFKFPESQNSLLHYGEYSLIARMPSGERIVKRFSLSSPVTTFTVTVTLVEPTTVTETLTETKTLVQTETLTSTETITKTEKVTVTTTSPVTTTVTTTSLKTYTETLRETKTKTETITATSTVTTTETATETTTREVTVREEVVPGRAYGAIAVLLALLLGVLGLAFKKGLFKSSGLKDVSS